MPPEMGVFFSPYKCPYMPLSGAGLPLYTNAPMNAPMCAQMPRARAQMPLYAREAENPACL